MKTTEELDLYIKSPEISGALLLTGKWGCGKTYRIDQFKKMVDSQEFAIVVISLFGVDSISALTQKVREQVALATFFIPGKAQNKPQNKTKSKLQKLRLWYEQKAKKPVNFFVKGLTQQAQIADKLAAATKFIPIERTIGVGKKQRQLVLVFDDFERSELSTKELLGAINEYVETKTIKTILIAAEDKIDDEKYREFKEKVIARTIKISPDYSSIIHEIIHKFVGAADYKAFLQRQEAHIVLLFTESKSENLRHLRSLLIDFERVFLCLLKIDYDEVIISRIFLAFGAMLFEHKDGNYEPGEYHYLHADSEMKKKYSFDIAPYRLVTLRRWITEGEWDESATCNEYLQRFCQKDLSSEDKLILWSFWDLNDTIVSEGFPLVLQKAYNGELTGKQLMSFISKIALARKWKIKLPVEVDYGSIAQGLKQRIQKIKDNEVNEPEHHTFITHEEQDILNEEEKKLYTLAFKLGNDLLTYLRNRRSFIDNMADGDEVDIRQLKNHYYISFDHEMMESLFVRYSNADVDIKRAIAHVISEIHFKDFMNPKEPESTLSIECLKVLLEKVKAYCQHETDSFARIHDQEFVNVIIARISDLEEKLQEHQKKTAQTST